MAAIQRTIRHLHLTAPGQAAVRRLLPTMEDALRCASLGDDGPRLMLVKRLALGRVPAEISPQALARLIEERTAQAAVQWVDAERDGAEAAACVIFESALRARTLLALRLVRGLSCAAWYWPLAVPEFAREVPVAANLRRMAWTVAAWPEARVALPAWLAALVRADGVARLAACMTPSEGDALVQRSGCAGPSPTARLSAQAPASAARPAEPRWPPPGRMTPRCGEVPAWIELLLGAAGTVLGPQPVAPPRANRLPTRQPPDAHDAARTAQYSALARSLAISRARRPAPRLDAEPGAPGMGPRLMEELAAGARSATGEGTAVPHESDASTQEHVWMPAAAGQAWLEPTACGGLLFLLPLLERLGLGDWLAPQDAAFAALVLHAALRRLQTPADDPAWQLTAGPEGRTAPYDMSAPSAWADPVLAPPRGSSSLDARLLRSRSSVEQADTWLAAARYWLRRAGLIGLATLVQRPARLSLTATHADLHFDLAATDLRVRRLGLDIDPGWLPWYGRVVGFHYAPRAP